MGKKVSEFNSLSEVTDGDLFMVTDDGTGSTRKVAWSAIKTSIPETDLDDLDSVDVTTNAPAGGSALVYDADNSKWVPGVLSDVNGHSPTQGIRYKYSSSTSPSGIGSGVVRFNSNVPASTNVMYLRDTDQDGIDHTSMLAVLFQQNTVFILRSNSNTSHYVKFAVSGSTTDMGNYFTVPVRHIESVAYPSNNSDATFTNVTQLYSLEGAQDFTLPENTADALDFVQGDDSYIKVDTTTNSEKITFGQHVEFTTGPSVVSESSTGFVAAFKQYSYTDATNSAQVRLYRAKGNKTSPTALSSGYGIGKVAAYGHTGSSFVTSGNLGWTATDDSGNSYFNVKARESDSLITKMTLDSDGLKIGIDTAAANAIDEYEEGTWTPTYDGGTANPTCTYDQQQASYVKIGKAVHIYGRIRTDSVSGGEGGLRLGGLPFAVTTEQSGRGGLTAIVARDFSGPIPVAGVGVTGTNQITLYAVGNSASDDMDYVEVGDLGTTVNDNQLHWFGSYTVD